MKILITGSSGLIGSALIKQLRSRGHEIGRLLRTKTTEQPYWNIEHGEINLEHFPEPDVVIHLAGENLADGRWNDAKKQRILNSRVNGTRLLVEYFSKAEHKPDVFISGSAIGFYGNRSDTFLDEHSAPGDNFSAEICKQWEAASQPLKELGIRLVNIRTGVVLSPQGGALKKMLLPFRLGLGGILGDGQQYISWVCMDDMINMLEFVMLNNVSGPVNMVAPEPVTNYQLTKTLGKVLHRPTIFPMPAFVARLLFGEMADELLLASTRVLPGKLTEAGFKFEFPQLDVALEHLLTS
jgi:uncharacterized protein (TIGR01777 family)